MAEKSKIYAPNHAFPQDLFYDFILLPYGLYYAKTSSFLNAKKGDTLRFFNGPERRIENVSLLQDAKTIDLLCRIRYGIPWESAFQRWLSYAILEGNGKDIIVKDKCIIILYDTEDKL